jgi:prepilin-type N-terminal cleavage/methylation domain-containing protein
MKQQPFFSSPRTVRRPGAAGFTLIELIIVVAILAFVAMVGLRGYANLRETQARKVNVANIKRIAHALATYETIHKEQGTAGYFKNFDSLIDVASSGAWYGTLGGIDWGTVSGGSTDARTVHGGLGIYDGSWKVLGPLYNAAGEGSGATATLDASMDENRGMRDTGLYKSLGIYYLNTNDVALLRNAGITQILLHNPSTQQASGSRRGGYCSALDDNGFTSDGLKTPGGGGPGFRPEMSAFYPVTVTNGLPVAIIRPNSTIYNDLGYQCTFTNTSPSASELTAAVSGQTTKLLAFGIGLNAECVKNPVGLGDAPYDPVFDKKNYRQYIAVFAVTTRGQGTPSTCHLAGVVDCAGNTSRAAEYGVNWSSSLN